MNFAEWLLKRALNRVSGAWTWVEGYRKMILEVWPLAFILTTLVGALWFIAFNLALVGMFEFHPTRETMYATAAVPYLVFIYNWVMAMYEIYDTERMATWEAVKRPYE